MENELELNQKQKQNEKTKHFANKTFKELCIERN